MADLSAVFMADGGFGGLRRGLKGGLFSPPVFKEGLGVVFPLLSKSDDNSVIYCLIIIPNRIETL